MRGSCCARFQGKNHPSFRMDRLELDHRHFMGFKLGTCSQTSNSYMTFLTCLVQDFRIISVPVLRISKKVFHLFGLQEQKLSAHNSFVIYLTVELSYNVMKMTYFVLL